MYLEHYGLNVRPFSLNPDPAFLYLSSQHSLAYHMLVYGLRDQPGITVVTGEVGSGKTTLLRHLLDQHDQDDLVVGLLADTDEDTAEALHQWVAMSFGLDHTGDKITIKRRLQEFLINNYAKGKSTVLIVDEAQNLSAKSLEQVRLLNNINSGGDELLKIFLVGQPELLRKLESPELMQLAQRVMVEFHLGALNAEDVVEYIRHRLQVSGADHDIFDRPAMYAIYYLGAGIPRLINTLCDYALLYGFSKGLTQLQVDAVVAAASGRRLGAVHSAAPDTPEMTHALEFVLQSTGIDLSRLVRRMPSQTAS